MSRRPVQPPGETPQPWDPGQGPPPGLERLQRVMAEAGVGSRRLCEELIEGGHVEVNDRVVTDLPIFINPAVDRVRVGGRVLPAQPDKRVYVLLNKPGRTISSAADEEGRRTVVDLVDHPSGARLYPVGRLDFETRGLVLLTNDGDLANRLTHPRFGVHKTYVAVVRGSLDDESVERLAEGIYLAERREGETVGAKRTARVDLSIVRRERDRTVLRITLREGRNRQVRRMLAAVGCPVRKLTRVAMGPLTLKGVAPGVWRDLSSAEVRGLRRASEAAERGRAELSPAARAEVERAVERAAGRGIGPDRPKPRRPKADGASAEGPDSAGAGPVRRNVVRQVEWSQVRSAARSRPRTEGQGEGEAPRTPARPSPEPSRRAPRPARPVKGPAKGAAGPAKGAASGAKRQARAKPGSTRGDANPGGRSGGKAGGRSSGKAGGRSSGGRGGGGGGRGPGDGNKRERRS